MRLVACRSCHAQFDVSNVAAKAFRCRCGTEVENRALTSVDAAIVRCGSCGAGVRDDQEACDYCSSRIVREPGSTSLICPECYSRNAEASRFCTACGVRFEPQPVPVDAPDVACVDCGTPMSLQRVAGLAVRECTDCRGLWIPADSFERLVERVVAARAKGGAAEKAPRVERGNPVRVPVRYRKCPVCEAFMLRKNYRRSSGVVIDRCHDHGTFLDADELEQLAGFVLAGGLVKADARDAAETAAGEVLRRRASRAEAEANKILMQPVRQRPEGALLGAVARFLNELLS